jgi:hypothetical protein
VSRLFIGCIVCECFFLFQGGVLTGSCSSGRSLLFEECVRAQAGMHRLGCAGLCLVHMQVGWGGWGLAGWVHSPLASRLNTELL